MRRANELTGPIHGAAEALERMCRAGYAPPRRLPVVLRASLRRHHDPEKVWVYDEANREWVAARSPLPRRSFLDRLCRDRPPLWWRAAELEVERALRSLFN